MELDEGLKINGKLHIIVTGQDGTVKRELVVPNLVVTAGKGYIASRMVGTAFTTTPTVMSHMAIGSGDTAPVIGDTTIETNIVRVELTSLTATGNVVTASATFSAGTGTGGIKEAGIFNAASGGIMLCRTVFPIVTKEAGDTIAITWSITVS